MHKRLRITVGGAVQGVGFRPFVYRLARQLGLDGWVANDNHGVVIEVEGEGARLGSLVRRLRDEAPDHAVIESLASESLPLIGRRGFEIHASDHGGDKRSLILPDLATCGKCHADVRDPTNRRHDYPFTNCTNCGPRFSIIREIPYDRPHTTMAHFVMCPACRAEYEDPGDRRFHAQPNACHDCGPSLELWDAAGRVQARGREALHACAEALEAGEIAAVKGLGGFHLMVDATRDEAVARLRQRKERPSKPLALMVHNRAEAAEICELGPRSAEHLESAAAPILLLRRGPGTRIAAAVAPDTDLLGVMLPYTPLHRLLLDRLSFPVVATSGNLSNEPICIDEREAAERLRNIADVFLVHDRAIERSVDDSVAWELAGELRLLRRSRGYAPLPVCVSAPLPAVLAVGGHLKSSVALSAQNQVLLSQHIGDLETLAAQAAFERAVADLLRLYEARPVAVACDLHPDYASTQWARGHPLGDDVAVVGVQHHHAHLASCLADNNVRTTALGVIWDGAGYGEDGTVWGGELLLGDAQRFERRGHLHPFRLPGGARAVREPRRAALALLWELGGEAILQRSDLAILSRFSPAELSVLARLLATGSHAPVTTSAGRLFDGVAALVGLHPTVSYEGQAALALEACVDAEVRDAYPLPVTQSDNTWIVDWRALVEALIDDQKRGRAPGVCAARFHNALVEAIVTVARACDEPRVALTGGCFQNRRLAEKTRARLQDQGHEVLLHRRLPPNDGGLAFGQIMVAAARLVRDG